jgi:multicomponent Na+:H+ antiporter subunit B
MENFRLILLIFLVICALCVSFSKKLLVSVVIFMSYSLVMSMLWILLESPDLAITEAAVGAGVTSVLFFITLKRISAIGREHANEQDKITKEINTRLAVKLFDSYYKIAAIVLGIAIITALVITVSNLPAFGDASNPYNNEVSMRYLEKGLEETGAVNAVTGMILDYRAFDTFGESCVLFIAAACVLILLRDDKIDIDEKALRDEKYEPVSDTILQASAKILFPAIMIFGIYILLNGHLSPGGGFSGGAIIGAGLILHVNAFGYRKTQRFFTEKTYKRVTVIALSFYCLAKSYSFFTGANHIPSGIPLGNAGDILSSGLILPLNICVGLVVACTMYAFYTLFKKGGM